MIKGHVDLIATNQISGWAYYAPAPDQKCYVSVRLRGKEVYVAKADLARPDLTKLGIAEGKCAFSVKVNKPLSSKELADVEVYALLKAGSSTIAEVKLPINTKGIKVSQSFRSYQSFDGNSGDSNSSEKLKRLRLPPLEGKSVLDIGCNEGFFSNYAIRNGARRVVGIDMNPEIINLAKQRTPKAEFINASWWNIPHERFDIILFLSAIHYEKRQKELLSYLKEHLSDDGILVLECGVYQGSGDHWAMVQRHDGPLRFPNLNYLIATLLDGFAVTPMGKSTDQAGDPVPRFVFHCSRARPTVLFIYGPSKSGKTVLARRLATNDIHTYSIDHLFHRVINGTSNLKSKVCEYIRLNGDVLKLDRLSAQIVEVGLIQDMVALIIDELPLEAGASVVEGEMLVHEQFRSMLARCIEAKGGIVWDVHRNI